MPVLERAALEASPLADLHAIASEMTIDGYRRLRKAALIDAILERAVATARGDEAVDIEPASESEATAPADGRERDGGRQPRAAERAERRRCREEADDDEEAAETAGTPPRPASRRDGGDRRRR